MFITSPRTAHLAQGFAVVATVVAFIATACVLKYGDALDMAHITLYRFAPSVSALLIVVAASFIYTRSDKEAWLLLLLAVINAMLLVAALSAMQAPPMR